MSDESLFIHCVYMTVCWCVFVCVSDESLFIRCVYI